MTGDEIIGDHLKNDMGFMPISVSPHGHVGSIFERLLYRWDPLPSPEFQEGRIHGPAADHIA